MGKKILALFFVFIALSSAIFVWLSPEQNTPISQIAQNSVEKIFASPTPTPYPLQIPPEQKFLPTNYHVFQSFNNCGPAALSMALSHYGIQKTQQELGILLRPYQNASGDNDDKSVTLEELAEESKKYGFTPYLRPNGSVQQIKLFITYDMPVITRTWLKENDDIGHFRVIKGYNEQTGTIIQDDSLQGKNLSYSYNIFNAIWKKFNYEYLVLAPEEKKLIAETIIGADVEKQIAWEKAVHISEKELTQNPNDMYARFNLSVALSHIGQHQRAVNEFEKVEKNLPFRALWYQIEPIESYYELGNDARVLEITNRILNYHNRAYSEAYILRGNVYKRQGKIDLARSEYEKAVFYNKNLEAAKEALGAI